MAEKKDGGDVRPPEPIGDFVRECQGKIRNARGEWPRKWPRKRVAELGKGGGERRDVRWPEPDDFQ